MLLRRTEESIDRVLTGVGLVVVLCAVFVGVVVAWNPFARQPADQISVAIDTPYVGQGVTQGTAMVMHGVKIGEVTRVASLPGGGVRLLADLQKTPVAGLTDAMKIDFRPINYFGVTGINVVAHPGGQVLRDGMQLRIEPQGNYSLQALLSRLGEVSAGAITPQLISVIDRGTRYTDALNPLFETITIALSAVADVQTVSTAQLLTNATGVSVATPASVDSLVQFGDHFISANGRTPFGEIPEKYWKERFVDTFDFGIKNMFSAVGRIEVKYVDDLLPAVDAVKVLMDPVPALLRPDDFADTLATLRKRFEKLYAGTPDQRALQVRIVLDNLPGVAAPLAAMGGPQ